MTDKPDERQVSSSLARESPDIWLGQVLRMGRFWLWDNVCEIQRVTKSSNPYIPGSENYDAFEELKGFGQRLFVLDKTENLKARKSDACTGQV